MDVREERRGGGLVLLADGEVEVLELLVESLGRRGVTALFGDEVVDVEAEGTDLAAKLVGRLRPVLLVNVRANVTVDAGLRKETRNRVSVFVSAMLSSERRLSRAPRVAASCPIRTTDSLARATVSVVLSFCNAKRELPSDRGLLSKSKSRACARARRALGWSVARPGE